MTAVVEPSGAPAASLRVLKRSQRHAPKVSFVLLDWSVRESFHFLDYLGRQSVPRESFEVLLIEYYSRESPALARVVSQVDTWVLLGMPASCYYHKHLMYNAGITMARGEILVFCDSDAMARESLVGAIIDTFEDDPKIVLHLDQFRNNRRDFYPFNFPSFADVLGPGCINNAGGRTKGIGQPEDPLHECNYGACMCARREDLIAIGGADEHLDYLGHICGPYEMTFRLANFDRRERWHQSEFLYHTWHPGQSGANNYLGPHDGRHMSTTALEALVTGRVNPYVENPAIRLLREQPGLSADEYERAIIAPGRAARWELARLLKATTKRTVVEDRPTFDYRGFRVRRQGDRYVAHLAIEDRRPVTTHSVVLDGGSVAEIRRHIDTSIGTLPRAAIGVGSLVLGVAQVSRALSIIVNRFASRVTSLPARVMSACVSLVRRTFDRVRRFRMERARISGSLASVIVNLRAVRRRPELAGHTGPLRLLTDRRSVALYVTALSRLGVLPQMEVLLVAARDMSQWSLETSWHTPSPMTASRFIVGGDFYRRYHALFAATDLNRRMTVL
jgi:hypothetical protein